jgi:hypothetical protein
MLALRSAIRDRLVADAALIARLGGPKVFDETPRSAETPYITFGEATARDWSSDGVRGHEHLLSLQVWSREGGDREALEIAALLDDLLDDASLALAGHRLVLLRVMAQDAVRPGREALRRIALRLRALTEVV